MAFHAFLKLDEIEGESTAKGHPNEIEVHSFSWGVDNTSSLTSGGGTTTSRSLPKAFTFTADVSRASPELFAHCANGSHIKEGTLTLRANRRGAQQAAFYTIKLTDIIVSSFNQAGSAGGDAPMDEFSLTFARVQVAYTQQSESGSPTTPVASGWDFRQNLKF